MAVFERLKQCSFEGIVFPVEDITVTCSLRAPIHEYPYSPGGAPEKLGRKLYTVNIKANFQATFKNYPNLWPTGLAKLRKLFENQTTGTLVIPTIGSIQAYCSNWSQTQNNKIFSGETATFTFTEDQTDAFLTENLVEAGVATRAAVSDKFAFEADKITPQPDLFAAIKRSVNSVLAIKDTAELYSGLLESKVLALSDLLQQADTTVKELQHPENLTLIAAFKDLWKSMQDLSRTIQGTTGKQFSSTTTGTTGGFVAYVTPTRMSALDVSVAVYKDASHAADIISINAIPDPYNIPANTTLVIPQAV